MKLALGAVQFGMDYGITNHKGQVDSLEITSILKCAKENNINTIDTSPAYGNSEEVLGNIGVDDWQIITKTTSLKKGVDTVVKNFHQSLNNLKQTEVDGLLIHDISDAENKQFDSLFKKLNKLKEEGLINNIGFSTYTPEQVDFLLQNFDFDLIQVPFNVFDNRLIEGGQLQKLKNVGVEIHARSIFLQGLLLDFENLPDYFLRWEKQFNAYQKTVKNSGLSLLEYALNFILNFDKLDKVIIGTNNQTQLAQIIAAGEKIKTIDLHQHAIYDEHLINPTLWRV